MKYSLPIEIVRGRFPAVSQEYGDTSNVAWYQANGVNITSHNGADLVIKGGKHQETDTYGTRLVCPVPHALLTRVWWDSPLSTKGNGIEIQWNDERGFVQMLCWHTSEEISANIDEFKEGDTIGYVGNSGLVSPKPSYLSVCNGAHLHLGTWINGVMVNPREIFDFTKWYVSETDTSIEKDLPPFQYFFSKVATSLASLFPSRGK